MYVCMYVYIYTLYIYIYIYTYIHIYSIRNVCVCMAIPSDKLAANVANCVERLRGAAARLTLGLTHACMYVYTHTHIYLYLSIYLSI